MPRRKTVTGSVRGKLALPERLTELRVELFGARGGPEMARRLGIPVRSWYNYERGVTVPAEVLLGIIDLTSVEAAWLRHGTGPKFRGGRSEGIEPGATSAVTAGRMRGGSAVLTGEARPAPIKSTPGKGRLGTDNPEDLPAEREGVAESSRRSEASRPPTRRAAQEAHPTSVAEILSKASTLKAPEELEELTTGLLALRARKLAPVASGEETRLLLAINQGLALEFTDRVASLIKKRDESGLSVAEQNELIQLADVVERRGVERAEALSTLAELRGVSLRELMRSLGVAAGGHG